PHNRRAHKRRAPPVKTRSVVPFSEKCRCAQPYPVPKHSSPEPWRLHRISSSLDGQGGGDERGAESPSCAVDGLLHAFSSVTGLFAGLYSAQLNLNFAPSRRRSEALAREKLREEREFSARVA